ncbi:MAG: MerR family transcriptional regulator [Cyclobacteriaceae bacterium]|nr:MerR family transcriptional regulator [Cyclobacteriaceae bacterium]
MKIGELSKKASVSRDTIRFYEKNLLMVDVKRPNEWNNYKDYPEENLKRIVIIKCLKKFGFTLKECRDVLQEMDENPNKSEFKRNVAKSKLEAINKKINDLVEVRNTLIRVLEE